MALLQNDPVQPIPPAQRNAGRIKADIRRAFSQMKMAFQQSMRTIWQNVEGVTPQDIFDEFGTDGVELFQLSDEMVRLMNQYGGESITSVVPPNYEYVLNQDGTVVVSKIENTETPDEYNEQGISDISS